jgi:hypothetical protein
MWSTEYAIETSASSEQIWEAWQDVRRWPEWNSDLVRAELSGPFAAGSRIVMTPSDGEPIELLIAAAEKPALFVDAAALGETVVRTTHRVDAAAGRRRVVYRMEITGPAGDELGPAISGDFPDVLAALVARVES